MPNLILRRNAVVKAYPDEFQVILTLPDGYELQVGGVSKQTDVRKRVYWQWSCLGGAGRSASREEAMTALKAAWSATDELLAEMRKQQEHTEWKYALWVAGYKPLMGKGLLRCRCGEMFDPDDHEAVRVHVGHLRGRP